MFEVGTKRGPNLSYVSTEVLRESTVPVFLYSNITTSSDTITVCSRISRTLGMSFERNSSQGLRAVFPKYSVDGRIVIS